MVQILMKTGIGACVFSDALWLELCNFTVSTGLLAAARPLFALCSDVLISACESYVCCKKILSRQQFAQQQFQQQQQFGQQQSQGQ